MKYKQMEPIAIKHNAVKTKNFDQYHYVNGTENLDVRIQDGACRALSAAFLVRNFTRAGLKQNEDDEALLAFGPKKFFEAFHGRFQQSDADKARFKTIAKVQIRYKQDGKMSEQESIEAATNSVAVLSRRMLQYGGHKTAITYGGGEPVTEKILPDGQVGYWLLSTGGHMMAVSIRGNGGSLKAKFFDPNAGLATFATISDLRAFLSDYFKEAKYTQVNFLEFRC